MALAYIAVVSIRACPSQRWTIFNGIPFWPASTAKAWRSAFGLHRLSTMPALRITDLTIFHAFVRPHGHRRPSFPMAYIVRIGISVRGTGTARKICFFRCFRVSKMIASSAASIRLAVNSKTSEIRAPVNARVRQNVETASHSFEAA